MDIKNLLDVFDCEMQCEYKGRIYMARDNGAIKQLPKDSGKPSRFDKTWSFGKKDPKTGYMMFTGNIRVHQVVCSAFHGPEPAENMVVDHIDTNRCNNRPENLHWVTRLENALENPYTRKKIILLCGSVEAFIANPSILRQNSSDPNISWMRTVTKEEAAKCKKNLTRWAKQDANGKPSGMGFDERLFSDKYHFDGESWNKGWMTREYIKERHDLKESLTPGAKQLDWKTPTAFPQVPKAITPTPLLDYLCKLSKGVIFCQNKYGNSPIYDAAISEDGSHLAVITAIPGVTNYALSEVYFDDGIFVHKSIRSFFTEQGAKKYFTISLGQEWAGGDVLEDYC